MNFWTVVEIVIYYSNGEAENSTPQWSLNATPWLVFFNYEALQKFSLSNFHAAWNEVDRAVLCPRTVLWRDIFPYSTGTIFQRWPHYLRLWITNVQPNVRGTAAWRCCGHKKVMTAMKDNCEGVGQSVRLLYDLGSAGACGARGGCCNELWTCIVCLKSLFPRSH